MKNELDLIHKDFKVVKKEVQNQKNVLPNLTLFCDEKQDAISELVKDFKIVEKSLKEWINTVIFV